MTEELFRNNEDLRTQMRAILESAVFRYAVKIADDQRFDNEFSTESALVIAGRNEGLPSVRLHNQRLGMEGFIRFLEQLTFPMPPKQTETPADWGHPEALEKLSQ